MKKTLIALALGALPMAAGAEVVLYGTIVGGVDALRQHTNVGDQNIKHAQVTDWDSTLGFRGSEDLGNGTKAIWQLSQFVNIAGGDSSTSRRSNSLGNNESFIGLKGSFGTIRGGYIKQPLRDLSPAIDPWSYAKFNKYVNGYTPLGLDRFTRFDNRYTGVRYDTPDMSGFTASVQFVPGVDRNVTNAVSLVKDPATGVVVGVGQPNPNIGLALNRDKNWGAGLSLNYKNNGFFAGYGLDFVKGESGVNAAPRSNLNSHVHRVTVGYDANNLKAVLAFQYAKNSGDWINGGSGTATSTGATYYNARGTDGNTKELAGTVSYTSGAFTPRISAVHGWRPEEGGKTVQGSYNQVVVGGEYAFSKRTAALLNIGWLKDEGYASDYGVGLGLRHSF